MSYERFDSLITQDVMYGVEIYLDNSLIELKKIVQKLPDKKIQILFSIEETGSRWARKIIERPSKADAKPFAIQALVVVDSDSTVDELANRVFKTWDDALCPF